MVYVVPIFVPFAPSLLHHNDVGGIYPTIFNLRMESIRFLPLYYMATPQSM